MHHKTQYSLAYALGGHFDLVGVMSFRSALSEEDASSSLERNPEDMLSVKLGVKFAGRLAAFVYSRLAVLECCTRTS